jgi:hypothetical protein
MPRVTNWDKFPTKVANRLYNRMPPALREQLRQARPCAEEVEEDAADEDAVAEEAVEEAADSAE